MAFKFIPSLLLTFKLCSGINLDSSYTSDTVLTSGIEYFVNENIIIDSGVIFEIPSNVVLSFNGTYTISVEGKLIIGCNDIDTINGYNSIQGIADKSSDILIRSITGNGQINIRPSGNASICNTNFENLEYGLYIESSNNNILIDNCEFHTISEDAIYLDTTGSSSNIVISDNVFIIMSNGKAIDTSYTTYGSILIQNNLISSNDASNGPDVNIECCFSTATIEYNTFRSGNNLYRHALGLDSDATIIYVENNHFSGYDSGITIEGGTCYVRYNTFIGIQSMAINMWWQSGELIHINYNNFINNTYALWTQQNGPYMNCNYNYFGINSTDQRVIKQQIADVCIADDDGKPHSGLIIWWPWFIQSIDFNQPLPENTSAVTFEPELLYCKSSPLISSGTQLLIYYEYGLTWNSPNLTLTAAGSPYYVRSRPVIINMPLIIEASVQITWLSGETMVAKDSVNINCDYLDTKLDRSRGLSNVSSSVIMSGSYGRFSVSGSSTGPVSICNTKFNRLSTAITMGYDGDFMIDNCEFYDSYQGVNLYESSGNKNITDCIFDDITNAIESEDGYVSNLLIENNLFTTPGDNQALIYFLKPHTDCYIRNNTFIYTGNTPPEPWREKAITLANRVSVIYIEYNTFMNFDQGVWVAAGLGSIKYNTFINNTKAVQICDCVEGVMQINYNNFIDNNYSIVLEDDYATSDPHQIDCNYNYYGTSSNDPNIVVEQIYDNCRHPPQALITWYPFFNQPIDFNSLPSNSSAIHIAQGELTCVTQPPTPSPTTPYYDIDCYNDSVTGFASPDYDVAYWSFSVNNDSIVTFDTCGSAQGTSIDIFRSNDIDFVNPLQISKCGASNKQCNNCIQQEFFNNYTQKFTLQLSRDNYTIRPSCANVNFFCSYKLRIFGCGSDSIPITTTTTSMPSLAPTVNYSNLVYEACVIRDRIDGGTIIVTLFRNNENELVEIEIEGPADRWFGIGFGGSSMNNTYAIISYNNLTTEEWILGPNVRGSMFTENSWVYMDIEVQDGRRTVRVVRPYAFGNYYDFAEFMSAITTSMNVIAAFGVEGDDKFEFMHEAMMTDTLSTSCSANSVSTPSPVTIGNDSEPSGVPTRTPISIPNIDCGIVPFECSNGKVLLPYYSVEERRCIYDACFTPSPTEKTDIGNEANMVRNLSQIFALILLCVLM